MRAQPTPVPVADVKCYHCGHISGQIIEPRKRPPSARSFAPRLGYTGPKVGPGFRLRCERCNGPVFLEDAPARILAPAYPSAGPSRRIKAGPKAA